MTLIEVLASLVILGTVLALLIAARGRYSKQLVVADQRTKAVAALDELIGGWVGVDRVAVPVNRSGEMTSTYPMVWRTRVIPSAAAADLGARVVRVEVYVTNVRRRTDRDADEPLTFVDLVVPAPKLLQIDGAAVTAGDAAASQPTTGPTTQEAAEDPQTFEDPRVEMGVP